jgi:twinkle protein
MNAMDFALSTRHRELLARRRIPTEIALEAGLHSRGENLCIPYTLSGTVLFTKIRGPEKRFWMEPKGQPLILWGLDTLGDAQGTLIITEGEFDALAWRAAGAPAVVSVPNGAVASETTEFDPSNDKRFQYLWTLDGKLLPAIAKFRRFILSVDNDEAGHVLFRELSKRLGQDRCWYLDYPDGCKDANEVLEMYGLDGLNELRKSAKPAMPLETADSEEIAAGFDDTTGVDVGWKLLDKHMRIMPAELIVVTGPPGSGKSQFVLNVVANLARLHGQKGAILQFEDNPRRNIEDLWVYAQKYQGEYGEPISENHRAWVKRMFRFVRPYRGEDLEGYTMERLVRIIKEAALVHDCNWCVIDPWNEIEHLWDVRENETNYTNRALAQLKMLARNLQITIFVVAHPSKGGGQKENINDMTMYDVSGSSAWNNKADHGVIVFRPELLSSLTYVKVAKSKDHSRMGIPGTVTMDFMPTVAAYRCVSSGAPEPPKPAAT